MITAILFDWGGVFNPQHESLHGYHTLAARYGHTPESLYALLYSGPEWQAARTGRCTSRTYWSQMQAALGVPGTLDMFLADLFAGEEIEPTLVALARLVRQRYRVGLLSNALDDLEELLEQRWHVADCFDVVVNSARLGVAKPDPRAYAAAVAALETPVHNIMFIDDKWRNVVAAREWGLPTIHYQSPHQLLTELAALKVISAAEQAQLLAHAAAAPTE